MTIFSSLVSALHNVGIDWACAVSVATDGVPSMTGKKAGVVVKLKEKVHAANGALGFWTFHCIIHKEALCCNLLKIGLVMKDVKNVNFLHARGLNHRQFDNILNDKGVSHSLPYHTEVRWLSQGVVVKRFLTVMGNCKPHENKTEGCGTGPCLYSGYN